MEMNNLEEVVVEENNVILSGTVLNIRTVQIDNTNFNLSKICIKRKFNGEDIIRVIYKDTLKDKFIVNNKINVKGRLVSKSMSSLTPQDSQATRLEIFVVVDQVLDFYKHDFNKITLSGYIFKPTRLRTTDTRRVLATTWTVADKEYGSMCIPVILWNDLAEQNKNVVVGTHMKICGRVQSRDYDCNNLKRTVYEVSVNDVIT